MRILTFSTLYPDSVRPSHGIFVENRIRELAASGRVSIRVLAPVPWFPLSSPAFGSYAKQARVPRFETRNGLEVHHPRYLLLPKIGMSLAPLGLYLGARATARRILAEGGDCDLIDAHYFYPDGVAAILLGRMLDKPVVITARGTDINLIPNYALPRAMIRWAANRAAAMITVCAALKDALVDLGADGRKIRVLRNGVDLALFHPTDRQAARARYGLDGPTLLSVGHLIPRKGHDIIIRALPSLPGYRLLIAGDGPERAALEAATRQAGVTDRVRFLGSLPQRELPDLYSAADILVLASDREGWANVLLEAMACGTPVVATSIWGTPEVVASPVAGELMEERTPQALVRAVERLRARMPDRAAVRTYAEGFSWDATTIGQIDCFTEVLAAWETRRRGAVQSGPVAAG